MNCPECKKDTKIKNGKRKGKQLLNIKYVNVLLLKVIDEK